MAYYLNVIALITFVILSCSSNFMLLWFGLKCNSFELSHSKGGSDHADRVFSHDIGG